MRRLRRLGLWIFAASGIALAVDWLPDALAELEFFRARDFRVVGATTLEEDYVLEVASIPPFVSIFDDPGPWEERLERHPLVRRVVIKWRLPATLVLTVEERTPVAFVASPVLEPVDRDGHVLPLDPGTHWLDLPLLRAAGSGARKLSPSQVRVLAMEVERLRADNPSFLAGVSEMSIDVTGDATATLPGEVLLRFRPPLSHRRLGDGLTALEDATRRHPTRRAAIVDLRYADQVVVSYAAQRGQE